MRVFLRSAKHDIRSRYRALKRNKVQDLLLDKRLKICYYVIVPDNDNEK